MPYYRQCGMMIMKKAWKETGDIDAAISGMPYDDMIAALDYYFDNYNEGRPFIIAGHSQGSALLKLALKNYFKDHSDYYERMVAAYLIGYSVTKDDLETYPYLKFATGETDTGVIISYNTEGPKNAEVNADNVVVLPNAISINPLNWKRDETYAPASENLGSLTYNEETGELGLGDMKADAQVNVSRGVVITNAEFRKPELCKIAGMAHDGFARSIRPVHTSADGDSIYAVSVGNVRADQDVAGALAAEVVSEAITRAVNSAESAYGFPAAKDLSFCGK